MFPLGLIKYRLLQTIITLLVKVKIIKFDKRPFSIHNKLTDSELTKRYRALNEAGIRTFPYPFSTALSIVSDIDSTQRLDYFGYTGILIDEIGLDFGDSFRLHHRTIGPREKDFAFFSFDGLGPSMNEHSRDLTRSLGFYEMLREYYLGNLDHFHAFSASGQQCIWLTDVVKHADGSWIVQVPDKIESRRQSSYNFIAESMPVVVIVILPVVGGTLPEGIEITVRLRDKKGDFIRYVPLFLNCSEWTPRFSSSSREPVFFSISEPSSPPILSNIKQIEINPPQDSNQIDISAVYILNTSRLHLLRMLSLLHDEFNLETNTLTDHGSRLFVDLFSEINHCALNAKRAYQEPLPALFSCVKKSDLYYSCLGDDPESFSYILPDLKKTFGIRFINPCGVPSVEFVKDFNLMNASVPARTRDGSMIYVARRMAPVLPKSHPLTRDMGTKSFLLRLKHLLEEKTNHSNSVWPLCTHLGNIKPKSDRKIPYFSKDILHKLQNRVFNIRGDVSPDQRIWFTRASLFYDYSLIIRSIGENVKRKGGNRVYIKSWHDPVLNRQLPVTTNQLHGVTFYVKESSKAQVFLDKREITDLVRNPADETGNESVTIIGMGAQHVVLDDYNFIGDAGAHSNPAIEYCWKEKMKDAFRGKSYAEIAIISAGTHTLTYYPKDIRPYGTQYFAYAIRPSSKEVKTGILVETESGGSFYFGNYIKLDKELTSKYIFPKGETDIWQLRIAPFYDMIWADDVNPGGTLPSHPTKAIHFILSGEAGEHVAIDRCEFIRPVTAVDYTVKKKYILGGQVVNPNPEMTVSISYGDGNNQIANTKPLTDPQGYFAFTGVPEGSVVDLSAVSKGNTLIPTRGRSFDVWGNDMNIIIENKV